MLRSVAQRAAAASLGSISSSISVVAAGGVVLYAVIFNIVSVFISYLCFFPFFFNEGVGCIVLNLFDLVSLILLFIIPPTQSSVCSTVKSH